MASELRIVKARCGQVGEGRHTGSALRGVVLERARDRQGLESGGRLRNATAAVLLVCPFVLGALGGCGTIERVSGRDPTVTQARVPGDTAGLSPMTGFVEIGAAFTDAGILGILDDASRSDSIAAALAVDKATDSAVKAFAASVTEEHHELRVEGEQLVKALSITPRLPASDPLGAIVEDEMVALRATNRGPEFDRLYLEKVVATDQVLRDFAEQAKRATSTDDIRAFIDRIAPVIQRHLERAQELRNRIPKTA